jgi:hypothetical protein
VRRTSPHTKHPTFQEAQQRQKNETTQKQKREDPLQMQEGLRLNAFILFSFRTQADISSTLTCIDLRLPTTPQRLHFLHRQYLHTATQQTSSLSRSLDFSTTQPPSRRFDFEHVIDLVFLDPCNPSQPLFATPTMTTPIVISSSDLFEASHKHYGSLYDPCITWQDRQ